VEELRQRVENECDRPDREVIDNAIIEWLKKATDSRVAAGRGQFEHSL